MPEVELLRSPQARPPLFEVPVFRRTTRYCYRIPAIVEHRGVLHAFAERRHGYGRSRCSDHGNIDIVVRRSADGGWTWGPTHVVIDHRRHLRGGYAAAGNPTAVVGAGDVLWLLYNVSRDLDGAGNDQGRVQDGDPNVERLAFAARIAWNAGRPQVRARDITTEIRRPEWRWFAFGPGHGVRLEYGSCAGRLVVPGYFSVDRPYAHAFATVFLNDEASGCGSDAHWRRGGVTSGGLGESSSESQVAERVDGSLWLTSRRVRSDRESTRRVAISTDAGEHWTASEEHPELISPISHGAIVASGSRLIFANPACRASGDTDDRLRRFRMRRWMTVSMSADGGRTWPWRRLVRPGSAAYPDLVVLEAAIGLLYEAPMEPEWAPPAEVGEVGWYENGISFVRFDEEWIRSARPFAGCDERQWLRENRRPPLLPTES